MLSQKTQSRLGWVAVVAFPLLAWFLGRGILQTPDGLSYLCDLRDGGNLIHPHHVLYGPLLALTAALARPFGGDLIVAGQWLGVISFAGVLAAARHWLISHDVHPLRSLLLLVLLASFRGLPLYAVRVEVYLPFAAAIAWLFVATAGRADAGLAPSRRTLITSSLLLALAALFHQLGALLAIPVLVSAWAPWRNRVAVVLGGGLLAVAGSWLGYVIDGQGSFGQWLVTYAASDVSEWGSFSHWTPAGLRDLGQGLATMLVPVPSAYATAGALGLLVVCGWLLRRVPGRELDPRGRAVAVFAATALVIQSVFVLWWLPTDTDFAIPSLWMLWVLMVLAWPRRHEGWTLGIVAVMMIFASYGIALPRLARMGVETRAAIGQLDGTADEADDYATQQRRRWLQHETPNPAD
jgi:hypothetical protein